MVRKWLNIPTSNSDYSADTESDCDSDTEPGSSPTLTLRSIIRCLRIFSPFFLVCLFFAEISDWRGQSRFKNEKLNGVQGDADGT